MNREFYDFFVVQIFLTYFSCLMTLARTSIIKLNSDSGSDNSFLVSDLGEKISVFHQ